MEHTDPTILQLLELKEENECADRKGLLTQRHNLKKKDKWKQVKNKNILMSAVISSSFFLKFSSLG